MCSVFSTKRFLAAVHAVASSGSETNVSSYIFILGLFILVSSHCPFILGFLIVFYRVVPLFLARRSCSTLCLGLREVVKTTILHSHPSIQQ